MRKTTFLIILILWQFQNIFSQQIPFTSRGIGGGGAMFSLSINPTADNEYYASCDMGELFHTTDFGLHYSQVDSQKIIGGHNSKVCFTSTPGILYTISYANDMAIPMKTTDGGTTWNPLPGNPDSSEETFSINVDYNNASRVIISYYGEIYFSSNGGNTFTNIHNAANSGQGNTVGGVFFDGNTIFIGTNDGLLVSGNGGSSWATSPITGIPVADRIWSFAGAKSGGITRLFCLTAAAGDIYPGLPGSDYDGFMKGVFSVDYGSGNWTSKMTGITPGTDFPMFVAMANNDINTVYLAGSNSAGVPTVLKSVNGGNLWNHVFNSTNNANINTGWSGQGGDRGWGYGECAFGMAVAPNNANKVIFGDFGFVHKTTNGGSTWQQAYVDASTQNNANSNTPPFKSYKSIGLENTTCWQIHWTNANKMWSCFSDIKGIKSDDAGTSWSFNYTGHTANSSYRIAQHPVNATLFMATSGVHDMYQSTRLADAQLDANDSEGKIVYSTNEGQTWQNLHVFNHPVFWITLDPNNPNIAYASVIHYANGTGVGGIYKTTNLNLLAASTWTLLPNPPRTEKHPASITVLNDGKVVCTYSGRRTSSFTASSGVFIYNPALNSWSDVSHSGMQYWTKDLVIDPNDASQNTWYACVFSGWGGPPNGLGGLYKTTNRGTTWTKLTGTTLDRATSCTFNPSNPNQLFITTEVQGLWVSSNINAATPVFSRVASYLFQQPERVFFNPYNPNEMWVSSFGNGMKVGDLSVLSLAENNVAQNSSTLYPNPAHDSFSIKNSNNETSQYTIRDTNGKILAIGKAQNNQEIDIRHFQKGLYFITIQTENGKKSFKIIKE
ncbi:T9SS type A sorting domain-containing protein [Flavobacterium humi]|uniref:T9SS type A sorting domain-containing protein n=1 Tax=Flavobacterium humi TaxID=2562683 RepID=A0A4Z0L968_9FLAO|nr:T9SS type A sorting domain-containing protein [Flavobacterium humi]TGD58145.1 T9SS type A sorting domain-containing protein [Flavobacterium humi]